MTWEETRNDDGSRAVMLVIRVAPCKTSTSSKTEQLQEMISASFLLGELQRHIAALATNLMKHFFEYD